MNIHIPPKYWSILKEGTYSGVSTSFSWIDEVKGTRKTTAIYWSPGGELNVLARTIMSHVQNEPLPLVLDGELFLVQRTHGTLEEDENGEVVYHPPAEETETEE